MQITSENVAYHSKYAIWIHGHRYTSVRFFFPFHSPSLLLAIIVARYFKLFV